MGIQKTIYCVMYCDEYETDYCDYAQEIMELYSKKTNAVYKGTLKMMRPCQVDR